MNRDHLGHHVDDLTWRTQFGERVHFDEPKKVAGIFALDQSLHCQCHSFDIDVLSLVPHRSAHVHDHAGRAFGMIAGLVDFDVFAAQSQRALVTMANQGVDDRVGHVHVGNAIAEFIRFGLLKFNRSFADHVGLMAAGLGRCKFAEDSLQQATLKNLVGLSVSIESHHGRRIPIPDVRPAREAGFRLRAHLFQLIHVTRLSKLAQHFHVDDTDLRSLGSLF